MIKYPTGKKINTVTNSQTSIAIKQVSATHRGMNLEEDLNLTNQYYLANDIAIIYKKPTPIQIVKVNYPQRSAAKIVEAYYRTPSTTDYNGLYRGRYIDFEAKETKRNVFPFSNISIHQIKHLENIIKHNGIAFVIIAFTSINEVYLIDASHIIDAYQQATRKSIRYQDIKEKGHIIVQGYSPRLNYLQVVDAVYFGGNLDE